MNNFHRFIFTCGAIAIAATVPGVLASVVAAEPASDASCIAIVMPVVQGMPGNATDVATDVRDLIANLNVKGTMRGANPMNPTTTITAKRIGECTR
jgi:hypothetical protein